jgi:peroxin-11B
LYRTNNPQSSITPWETTKKQLGIARKFLRLGKFLEHFKAAAVAADKTGIDPVLKFCAVGRQLGYAGYLSLDNLCVVCMALLYRVKEGKAVGHRHGRLAILEEQCRNNRLARMSGLIDVC